MTQRNLIYILLGLLAVYCVGFGIDIMDIDASQYAEMSREMNQSASYLQVFELGKDYLDKPPFLFWISSISIKIFGVNNFAYCFPSFLFGLLAIFSTYKFALLYYKREIAILAAIILATSQAFFLMNHDVRTDTILMGWVIYSIWQLAAWFQKKSIKNLILASIAIGCGMLTKGPIAIIVPVLAFGAHFICTKNIKALFTWQHLLSIIIMAIVLLPMSIGLYHQFDMQPQKIVNDKTGVSGLRFFYWTQSFGRITGESSWNNNANIFFLLQNLLWSFLPWVLVFFTAIFVAIKNIFKQKFKFDSNAEYISIGGFILSYLALGSSKYQLPHYIFVVLPLAAIITAKFLFAVFSTNEFSILKKFFEKSHFVILSLLWIILLVLLCYCFPANKATQIAAFIFFTAFLFLFLQKNVSHYFLKMCIYSIIGINFFLNVSIYPSLLKYQTGNSFGRFISKNKIPANRCYIYQDHIWHSLHYYANNIIKHKDEAQNANIGDFIILDKSRLVDFEKNGKKYSIVFEIETFPITKLNVAFINPITRKQQTETYLLIKIK